MFHTLPLSWHQRYLKLYNVPKDRRVKTITFIVTEQCNLRCTYCYEVNKRNTFMTIDTAKKAVDFILSDTSYVDDGNVDSVILEFTGGEPLLQIDLIEEIIYYFDKRTLELNHKWFNNYMIGISTNGLLYLNPKTQAFIEKHKHHLSIGISIDGDKDLHDSCRVDLEGKGSFDRVLPAVQNMLQTFNETKTKVTFAHENLPYLSKSIKYLFDIGIKNVYANTVFENVWEQDDDKLFYKELVRLADIIIDEEYYKTCATSLFVETLGTPIPERNNGNWCGGNGEMLAIGVNGDIYPCVRYAPVSLRKGVNPLIVGDVFEGTYNLRSPQMCELCSITRRSQSTDECFNCPVAQGCAWCSGYNYEEFGTPNKRATYICKMHKARVKANWYYWNKLYKKLGIDKKFILYLTEEDSNGLE